MIYVDDGIFLGPDDEKLQAAICEIQEAGLNIEVQGHPAIRNGFMPHIMGYKFVAYLCPQG